MKTLRRVVRAMTVIALFATSSFVAGVPGTFVFVEDARCDPHTITLGHELGETPAFPIDELISAVAFPIEAPLTCTTLPPPTEPTMPDDFIVMITNLSPFSWIDLFFVADAGILYGNVDGVIGGGDAFKIDTSGVNAPLLSESGISDLIFSPGEAWTFIVQDWRFPAPPDIMGSIGVGTSSDDTTGTSWASIVAIRVDTPISEPGTLPLLAIGVMAGFAALIRVRSA